MKDNDWGISNYPLVLGHEGVGRITKIGSSVKYLKVGDKVGITWARDSCSACDYCRQGRENICENGYQGLYLSSNAGPWGKVPYNEHGGCFSKVMRIEERFAILLPENLKPEVACPLICGGGTVFESVVDYVKPNTKVAIASIGGLGTAAIRFAKMYGGHVTALSRGETKRDKSLGVGADDYIGCLGNEEAMAAVGARFDVIIDTSPVNANVAPFMGMLKNNGTYCRVGIPSATNMTFQFDYIPLIFTQKKIAGSIVTGTRRMATMLELVDQSSDLFSKDNEDWKTEIVNFSEVNEVMEKLSKGQNSNTYRYLLKW
jgi:D-arabinose 1-dehydrogenase-like Zn-dependent alcohol dehydrogenase